MSDFNKQASSLKLIFGWRVGAFLKLLSLIVILIATLLYYLSMNPSMSHRSDSVIAIQPQGDVANGAYLARISGCIACHTDTKNPSGLVSGAPLKSSFGVFYAPNLSADKEWGIGNWSLADFSTAVREGVSPTGEHYYPAFPYEFFSNFSDQDIRDLWAAFQSVPANAKRAQSSEIDFPYNLKFSLPLWKRLYQLDNSVNTDQLQLQRGQFLVEVAGHCAACHTPRNILGALQQDQWLQGVIANEGGAPPITKEALLLNGWDSADLAYAFKTGIKPDGDVFGAKMQEIIEQGTQFMSEADRLAMADYLLEIE